MNFVRFAFSAACSAFVLPLIVRVCASLGALATRTPQEYSR